MQLASCLIAVLQARPGQEEARKPQRTQRTQRGEETEDRRKVVHRLHRFSDYRDKETERENQWQANLIVERATITAGARPLSILCFFHPVIP
jgi:hypothetical protein